METCTYATGVETTTDVTGGRWKPIILCNLRHGVMRPNDLKCGITGISQKMLTQQLRELERNNIIERKVYSQVPPEIEYYLSDYGRSLFTVLDNLCDWGESHVTHLQEQDREIYLKCED